MNSKVALLLSFMLLFIASFWFYPKWKMDRSEATISWDVSGYYWYLPATFIYQDVKKLDWADGIRQQYAPTTHELQSFDHPSGNKVMKYSAGMSLQYLPFFITAHYISPPLGFPQDGFSKPYQFAIQFGSLLFCFVGLWFLRKILKEYFSDSAVGWTILLFAIGSNYLNYSAIDGAMTHNWLFSWYAIMLWLSIRFYTKPSFLRALGIGLVLGIMALTRPTEIIAAIIPLAWGLNWFSKETIIDRLLFIKNHFLKYLLAILAMITVGSIQLIYWKYATGDWLVYSYEDQGFYWTRPHFMDYTFNYRSGWLLYTPLMIFAWIGFIPFIKKKIQVLPILGFAMVAFYITAAWDVWWYGGRAMVQYYPVLAFPFAAFLEWIGKIRWFKYLIYGMLALCVYLNIWWTYHAHGGSLLHIEQMTKPFYWRAIGRWTAPEDVQKLLDTDVIFEGERKNVQVLYSNDFEQDSFALNQGNIIQGTRSRKVGPQTTFSPVFSAPIDPAKDKWIRAWATFSIPHKEWGVWRMPQFIVKFKKGDQEISASMMRIHRFLHDGQTRRLYFDAIIPDKEVDSVEVLIWNAESQKETWYDEVAIEVFDRKN